MVIDGIQGLTGAQPASAIIIGKFDGVHVGHAALIKRARAKADEAGLRLTAVTFARDPDFKQILSDNEKFALLISEMGVDCVVSVKFDSDFADIQAESFCADILKNKLNCAYVLVGGNFRFGKNAGGDFAALRDFGVKYGFKAEKMTEIAQKDGINPGKVSSAAIREMIARFDFRAAEASLGRKYFVSGEVRHGRELGRELGFPTINVLPAKNKLLPPFGVYATKTRLNGRVLCGVTNVGVNPTVNACGEDDEKPILVETFLFDFNEFVYGAFVNVEFCERIRPETKYLSLNELQSQVERDKTAVRRYFNYMR